MSQPSRLQLTAPCGLDCFNCHLYETNITEEMRLKVSQVRGIQPDKVACKGCRIQGAYILVKPCATLDCIQKKGLDFCYECDEFPCLKLAPAQDGANSFPHNFKLFNLCRMKAIGVERWAEEEALQIRHLYYDGQLVPGSGPVEKKTDA